MIQFYIRFVTSLFLWYVLYSPMEIGGQYKFLKEPRLKGQGGGTELGSEFFPLKYQS